MLYLEKPRNMIPLCNTWHLGLSLKITNVLLCKGFKSFML